MATTMMTMLRIRCMLPQVCDGAASIVDAERDAKFDDGVDIGDAGIHEVGLGDDGLLLRLQHVGQRDQSMFVLELCDARGFGPEPGFVARVGNLRERCFGGAVTLAYVDLR